jgi:signal transduction histidine kinase
VAHWGSLCEFTIDIQDEGEVDLDATPSESTSNAIRHGMATRIDIVVSTRPVRTCIVEITGSGTGPQGASPVSAARWLLHTSMGLGSGTARMAWRTWPGHR